MKPEETPLASLAKTAGPVVIAAAAVGSTSYEIAAYRYDPRDPKPVNVDRYEVWDHLPANFDLQDATRAASTSADKGLPRYPRENVFLLMKDRDDGHWLDSLPATLSFDVRST